MTEEQNKPLCYTCITSGNCEMERDEKLSAQHCERKFEMPECPEYKQKAKTLPDLYNASMMWELLSREKSLDDIKRIILSEDYFFDGIDGRGKTVKVFNRDKYVLNLLVKLGVITLRPLETAKDPIMYLFDGKQYIRGAPSHVEQLNYRIQDMNSALSHDILNRLRISSYFDNTYFSDFDPKFLNLQNCVLNLRDRDKYGHLKISTHEPDYRMTSILPVKYDPDAYNGEFIDFTNQIVEKKNVLLLQEIAGYCLYRTHEHQHSFMLNGSGANGKSQWTNILIEILGRANVSFESLQSICMDKFSAINLYGKYANISGETPRKKLTSTDTFKRLTGGDFIPAEEKYGQRFNFRNYAKLVFNINQLPSAYDFTYADWRRWILIDFPYTFEGIKAVKDIWKILTDTPEKCSGILNWYIEGLDRLLKNDKFTYDKTPKQLEDDWTIRADLTLGFVTNCISEGSDDDRLLPARIWNEYLSFCSSRNQKSMTEKLFWKSWKKLIDAEYPDAHKNTNAPYDWIGLRYKKIETNDQ